MKVKELFNEDAKSEFNKKNKEVRFEIQSMKSKAETLKSLLSRQTDPKDKESTKEEIKHYEEKIRKLEDDLHDLQNKFLYR